MLSQNSITAWRLLPICQRGYLSSFLPLFKSHHLLYSTGAKWTHMSSHDVVNKNKEIDIELLFHLCTKPHMVKCLHAYLVVLGKAEDIFMAARLVHVYAYLGDISFSRATFNQIPRKDTYSWNLMISAYLRNDCSAEALSCLYEMLSISGVQPDFYTFPPALKACRKLIDGVRIHCLVLKLGFEWDIYVSASLVHMYCRFGFFHNAIEIFKSMPFRDMGCWNAVISGLCQNGSPMEALDILDEMRLEGIKMDKVTISTILPICAQIDDVLHGQLVHLYAFKHGLESEVFVSNALINFYAKVGKIGDAKKIFNQMVIRDLVSWNSIIAAYEQNSDPDNAIQCFIEMQSNGVQSDLLTLLSLASSIAQTKNFRFSRSIHGFILRRHWIEKDVMIGNAVVDMYAKLGMTDCARIVFDEIPIRDVISWNTMITGYSQNGFATEAIEIYTMMEEYDDLTPNQGTWASILPAYAHLGALQEGMKIHGKVLKIGLDLDIVVGTCLVDLYGKCGRLDAALSLFYELPRRSSVPWNAIISCHGIHGHGIRCLQLFREMLEEGVMPDRVTFLSLLAACSHSGLVDQGRWYFQMMQKEYGIKPSVKHYGCMVDLFGRAGHLEVAFNFIKSMPLQPDASVWGALLAACRIHGNVELGKLASDHLFEVDIDDVGYYVLLSNLYATSGKWEGGGEVRSLARNRGLRKTPGWSSIVLRNKIEVFYMGNQSHAQSNEIYKELQNLTDKIKSLGHSPDYSFVLQDVDDEEKEHILTSHSERLAIAYGILNSPPKSPIRIFKNLRICGDCHTVTKLISKITEREIVVRDSNRFHLFKNGFCSCGDYW